MSNQLGQQTAASRRRIAGERIGRSSANEIRRPGPQNPSMSDLVSRGRAVPGWLLIGLAVVVVAVLAFDGLTRAQSVAAATPGTLSVDALNAAPAAAEKAAAQILSYDYARLHEDTAAASALMTPDYSQTFLRTVDDLLAKPATEQRGVVSAKVMASGVVSADAAAGTVDVLLFVDQTSTTKASQTPQTALNRVVLTMVDQDGRWLVDDVTAL
jgi:Mce-associated membrane protein